MADEWREVRVGDLVDRGALMISDGYRVRNEELGTEGVPFVRGGDIGDGWINTRTKDYIRPELVDRVQQKLTQAGDAAFITKGTVGRAGWLRPGQPRVVFAPQVAYWRVTDPSILDPGFIFYLMRSHGFQAALDGVKTHGAMAADYVSISQQYDFRFRFPGVKTQTAIAHVLGTLDAKIELNRRIGETLEAMARALYKSWFVDFDPVRAKAECRALRLPQSLADLFPDRLVDSEMGETPDGWDVATFGDVVEQVRDTENPLASPDTLFRHFSIPAFDNGQFPKLEFGETIKSQKSRVPPGVVLLSKLNPEISRVWLVDVSVGDRAVCSTELLVLRPQPPYGRSYVYCVARSEAFRQRLEGLVTGTSKSHQRVPPRAILDLPVVRPPSPLLKAFERAAGQLLERTLQCRRESCTLVDLRESLLPKLISGELRVASEDQ